MALRTFDTGDHAFLATPAGALTATPFSMMLWIRMLIQNNMTQFGVWSSSGQGERAWRMTTDVTPREWQGEISIDGVASTSLDSLVVITLNQLYHVGMDFDGTTWRIYVDGVETNSKLVAGSINASVHDVGFGCYDDGAGGTSGESDTDIEDARYYNRLLSAAEWQTIHAAQGRDGITQGLITRWPLNERPAGTVLTSAMPKDIASANLQVATVSNSPIYQEGTIGLRRRAA